MVETFESSSAENKEIGDRWMVILQVSPFSQSTMLTDLS